MNLRGLIAAVGNGTATMEDFASVFPSETAYGPTTWGTAHKAFAGSLDAAKRLHDALLPGWFPGMSQNIHDGEWFAWVQNKAGDHFTSFGDNPARCWLLAILRALDDQREGGRDG